MYRDDAHPCRMEDILLQIHVSREMTYMIYFDSLLFAREVTITSASYLGRGTSSANPVPCSSPEKYQDILTLITKSTIQYFLHQSIFSSYKPCPVCDTSSAAPPRGLVKTPRIPLPMPRTIPEAGEFLASRSLLFSDWITFCMGWSARPATAPVR